MREKKQESSCGSLSGYNMKHCDMEMYYYNNSAYFVSNKFLMLVKGGFTGANLMYMVELLLTHSIN